jgi:transposase, IS5 family
MIATRRLQRSFADGFIAEEIGDLWEPWMRHADEALNDDCLLEIVQQELSRRIRKSRTRGRPGTTAEIVVRMLLLKHMRGWSFADLSREVRANLVYREFTGIGAGKVPDDKTMGRLARQLGSEAIGKLHRRTVEIALSKEVIEGRKMRVDTTVVETNIHYPTDSTLMGDGVRVLIRVMKRVAGQIGEAGAKFRDRSRSVKRRILEIAYAARNKNEKGQAKMKAAYTRLLEATGRVVGQAQKFSAAIAGKVKGAGAKALRKAQRQLDEMIPRVRQVMKQARARVMEGNTRSENKMVSVFEPDTEVIRKGKASKPTEFGKMVSIQEAENQIVIHCEVFSQRAADSDLLIPAIEKHKELLGRVPDMAAADAGFFSAASETAAKEMGVKRVAVPSRSTKSAKRKEQQKARWFKSAQKWRTGCEGRISVLKRRHGLNRSRYKGTQGMKRWVGLGVIADNFINIGLCLAAKRKPAKQ